MSREIIFYESLHYLKVKFKFNIVFINNANQNILNMSQNSKIDWD